MEDLEICKFITLLGLKEKFTDAKSIEFDDNQMCFWVDTVGFTSWPLLTPLTDDGLCFKLMIKYKLDISLYHENTPKVFYSLGEWVEDKSLNKAICLAIIEVN